MVESTGAGTQEVHTGAKLISAHEQEMKDEAAKADHLYLLEKEVGERVKKALERSQTVIESS